MEQKYRFDDEYDNDGDNQNDDDNNGNHVVKYNDHER